MQRLIDDNQPIEIPPIECGQYLLDFLYEVGPVLNGDMGSAQLTHVELNKWQENIGLCLSPWEVRVLRMLSLDYLIQSQQSTKPECVPPYGPVAHRAAVAKKIDAVFG
ncbi:MAG: hypothetical protein U1A72_01355 [Sulfuritalea sp.]|nr:hypothetical protein [Sulfuritalea sp.]